MKTNYIFNCIDLDKCIIPKSTVGKEWKKSQKKIKKLRKERKYRKRIPKSYKIYIKSEFWEKRKNIYYRKYGKKCFICGSVEYIQLNHLEYKYFGEEKDESLVALCRGCHEEFHSIFGVKHKMYEEFNEFIDLKQGELQKQFI
jgi:5-methylcytosine-specific restriction endonuclease McrA